MTDTAITGVSAHLAADGDIEIVATGHGVSLLADAIATGPSLWRFDEASGYSGDGTPLVLLDIAEGTDRIKFAVDGGSLMLTGDSTALDNLARSIRPKSEWAKQTGGVAPHMHLEYFPDHPLLAADSIPVVLTATTALPND